VIFDPDYGKSIPYTSNPVPTIDLLQESTVVFAINTAEFYAFYVDLLTRPVPVKFVHPPPAHNSTIEVAVGDWRHHSDTRTLDYKGHKDRRNDHARNLEENIPAVPELVS